jgi:hypothetical protein
MVGLGLVADASSGQRERVSDAPLADVGRGAVAAHRKRTAFLAQVDPDALSQADAFAEAKAHFASCA